jgi:hypothetical protein
LLGIARDVTGVAVPLRIDEFRRLVKQEFGENLKHATPANVREFVDGLNGELLAEKIANRIVIDEPCSSYEEVIKDFFARALDLPTDDAVIALWTLGLDLAFAMIESQYADRLASMFQDSD